MGRISDYFRSRRANRNEAKLNFTPKAPPHDSTLTDLADDIVNKLLSADQLSSATQSSVNDLTSIAERRDQRYSVYDQMRQNDSLAAAVLEMYADDITQVDPQGRTIWVESDNSNIAEAGNRLLRILKINDNIWDTAYSLTTYGDVYFELFRKPKKSSLFSEARLVVHETDKYYDLEDYIEKVPDPSEMFDLVEKGVTGGFARTHVNENKVDTNTTGWDSYYMGQGAWSYKFNRDDIDIYDSQKFIHIFVPDAGVRHPYKLLVQVDPDNPVEYTVSTGKSLLYDAYRTSQQLQLMENAILLSRLTRASVYRIIQVSIGQKNETDTLSLLNRIKTLLDKKQTLETNGGSFSSYANPGPEVSNIIVPVKENGQGGISVQTLGGDYDPKSLADLDYYINKELASFKVPRQFLNFTDGGGFNGGSSLAKISAQYAHRIVRYKRAIITAVTTLLNIFFDNRMPEYVGQFEVKMTPVTTIEDAERVAMSKDKLDMVSAIMDKLDGMDDIIGKFKILKNALEDAYPNEVVSSVLDDYIKKLEVQQESGNPDSNDDDEGDDVDFGGPSGGGDSSFMSMGGDADLGGGPEEFGSDEDSFSSPSSSSEGGSEFPTDLSGEGVDMTDTDAVDNLLGEEN